jgi:hypothetical protein
MTKNDGGPAFPQNDAAVNRINNEAGMSHRDYLAAHCPMTIAEFVVVYGFDSIKDLMAGNNARHWSNMLQLFAMYRYEYADAMIQEKMEK